MGSYLVKTDDIRNVIAQMATIKPAQGTLDFRPELLTHLSDPPFRRIKWFFYCDDRQGNTIRIFDTPFLEMHGRLFSEKCVLLRGKNLGNETDDGKRAIMRLFSEVRKEYPSSVTYNGTPECLDYLYKMNSDSGEGDDNHVNAVTFHQPLHGDQARYQPLVDKTYLDHSFFRQFESLLTSYRQVILEGPPGSGKTWVATRFAEWWTDPRHPEAGPGSETRTVQFHESYGYEDFFQGIRPQLLDRDGRQIEASDTSTCVSQMVYRNANGIFYDLCEKARANKDARFVLVIDEINRGKTSRIFGELLYLLEYRGEEITLASGQAFRIPKNVYLIGTMNTADRSIALVDYALRRRFKFVTLNAYRNGDAPVLRGWLESKAISDAGRIVSLFCGLNDRVSAINPHFIVGHSYFMVPELADRSPESRPECFPLGLLDEIWQFSVLPLLSEYEPHKSLAELERTYGLASLQEAPITERG